MHIVIVGGGPSGLLAAIAAAEKADKVVLFNKNPEPGKKISAIPQEDFFFSEKMPAIQMASRFGEKAQFVKPVFQSFSNDDLVTLFQQMGLDLSPDSAGHYRANGLSGKGLSEALLKEATKRGVIHKKSSRVTEIIRENGGLSGVIVNGSVFPASRVILATGSFSSPKFGATRDGYTISEQLGHQVTGIKPALVDLVTNEKYGKELGGEILEDVKISIFADHKLLHSEIGAIKFTPVGVSGPVILNQSAEIIDSMKDHEIEIRLDFMPDEPRETFETWLMKEIIARKHVLIGQLLDRYFNPNAIKAIQLESRIKLDKSVMHISHLERKSMIHAIKDFRLTIKGHKPFNSTRGVRGGVSIEDIDPNTMQSKKVKDLYFAGDIIDVLGPYGGYNMQFAFSSGYVAGKSAAG